MDIQKIVGIAIADARGDALMTQKQFAQKLNVSVQYIKDIEAGRQGMTMTQFQKLCEGLGASDVQIKIIV